MLFLIAPRPFRTKLTRGIAPSFSPPFVHSNAITLTPMKQLLRTTTTFALALVFTAGMAFGQSNEAVVEQINNNNETTVNQSGQWNAADVNQGVDEEANELANNLIGGTWTGQVGSGTANNNEITIDQAGDRNVALASQGYAGVSFGATRTGVAEGNTGSIEQIGSRNRAYPGQGLRGGRAFDNDYSILQDGGRNVATVAQGNDTGYAEDNEAIVEQFGNQNSALIEQGVPSEANYNFTSTNSLAEVYQDGSGNDATISQSN